MEKKAKKIIKEYIKDFIVFFNNSLKNKVKIFICIFFVLTVLIVIFMLSTKTFFNIMDRNLYSSYKSLLKDKLLLNIITVIAGVVPYMYIPVLAGLGYICQMTIEFGYIFATKNFFLSLLVLTIPYLLNILSISLATSVGIYFCKINTTKYNISQHRNMNWDTFRLEIYKIMGNKDKQKRIEKTIKTKETRLASKDVKTNYKQILNVIILCTILQLISSLIEYIII